MKRAGEVRDYFSYEHFYVLYCKVAALLAPSRLASLTLISTHAGGLLGTLPPTDGIGKFLACFSSLGGTGAVDAGLDMLFPASFLDRRQKRRQRPRWTAESFLPVRSTSPSSPTIMAGSEYAVKFSAEAPGDNEETTCDDFDYSVSTSEKSTSEKL